MQRITQLARETSAPLSEPLPAASTETPNDKPFLFVVCGEVNSGKSSFINGLLGQTLCEISDLPQTQTIRHYRYADSPSEKPIAANTQEIRRPLNALAKLEIVDSPGLQTGDELLCGQLQPLIHPCDLLFCVLPISNPWAAATWNFLSTLSPESLRKAVIIIQQADERLPQELGVLRDHVADLASKRLNHTPPIFTVSAHLAIKAKHQQPAGTALMQSSGYTLLESFISSYIDGLENRRAHIKCWQKQAADALVRIEDHIEKQTRSIRDQNRFMDQLEEEINQMREHSIQRLPVHLINVAETFQKEAAWVSKRLHGKLGAIRSITRLFFGDRTGALTEAAFIERIRSAVESVATQDSLNLVEACKDHWLELGNRVEDTMGVRLTTKQPIEEILQSAQELFVKRLSRASEQGINNLKVRNQLDKDLRHRSIALKSFTGMALFLVSAAATCGALQVTWAPLILLSLAAFFAAGAILSAWVTRRAVIRDFKRHLLDTCGAFANTLRSDYEDSLRIVFKDYADTLSEVRDHLGREKLAVEPQLRAWQEIFLTLKTIEQDC